MFKIANPSVTPVNYTVTQDQIATNWDLAKSRYTTIGVFNTNQMQMLRILGTGSRISSLLLKAKSGKGTECSRC